MWNRDVILSGLKLDRTAADCGSAIQLTQGREHNRRSARDATYGLRPRIAFDAAALIESRSAYCCRRITDRSCQAQWSR